MTAQLVHAQDCPGAQIVEWESADQIKRAARGMAIHSRDETGRDESTGRPWRRAVWSLPSGALTRTTAPTAPTGEGSHTPTTPIYAGQAQSVQSVQSVCVPPDWEQAAPLDETPRPTGHTATVCTACGGPLHRSLTEDGITTHPTCLEAS